MADFFDRVIKVRFPSLGKEFDGSWDKSGKRPWRIEFTATHKIAEHPNLAVVKIFNAKRETRELIAEENTDIIIEAGYKDFQGEVFVGIVRLEKTLFSDTDIICMIEAGDSDEGYQYATFSKKYDAGSNEPQKVVDDIVKVLEEYKIGKDRVDVPGKATQKGRSYSGRVTNVLNQLSRETDTVWNIQDGIFSMYPADDPLKEKKIFSIDRESGMIGVPEQTDIGINIISNMNYLFRPGLVVEVDSLHFGKNEYRIENVEFTGNNYDGQHHANLELRLLEGGGVIRSQNRHAGL